MQQKNGDRRSAARVIFELNEGLTATLRDKKENHLRALVHILNLSENGMQFTTKSTDRSPFKVNDSALLTDIYLNDDKYPNLDIELTVRWILNPPLLKYIGIGCEFINIPELSRISLHKILSIKRL